MRDTTGFPGGRTSEPAAVRSDAGSNRAAAGTGGIEDSGQARIGIGLRRVGIRRGVAKVGRTWGNFALFWCGSQIVRGAPNENLLTLCEQAK
jgi:hypothetical protein